MTEDEDKFLRDVLPPQRDPITGLFPANPHRKKIRGNYNFKAIVAEYIEAHGGWVEDVLIDIFRSMLMAAQTGDVAAAKLLLDRFCGKDADVMEVMLTTSKLSDVERATRIQSILASAAERAEASRAQGRPRITVTPANGNGHG